MHVKKTINGTQVSALVDTGATDSFIQKFILTKLGLSDLLQPYYRQVVFGNGQTEMVRRRVHIPVQGRLTDRRSDCSAKTKSRYNATELWQQMLQRRKKTAKVRFLF